MAAADPLCLNSHLKLFEVVRMLRTCVARERTEVNLPCHLKFEQIAVQKSGLQPKWRKQVVRWMHTVRAHVPLNKSPNPPALKTHNEGDNQSQIISLSKCAVL
jgi:hypothetical protein